jgi:hypothetical protein
MMADFPPLRRVALEHVEALCGRALTEAEVVCLRILDARLVLLESAVRGAARAAANGDDARLAVYLRVAEETLTEMEDPK